jgi:hypothetical protein
MAQEEKPPNRGRGGKMHPLFVELYLSSDPDDSPDQRRPKRSRARRPILQKRTPRSPQPPPA